MSPPCRPGSTSGCRPRRSSSARVEAQATGASSRPICRSTRSCYSPRAKYLYIGRDGRDVVWSMYNHHANANDVWYAVLNDTPGRVGPPIEPPPASVRQYFLEWLDGDGHPVLALLGERPPPGGTSAPAECACCCTSPTSSATCRARSAGSRTSSTSRPDAPETGAAVEHCCFDWMKAHAKQVAPLGGSFWDGGAKTFIHKGTNGRWRDELTADDCRRYEGTAQRELGDDCAHWLATGHWP